MNQTTDEFAQERKNKYSDIPEFLNEALAESTGYGPRRLPTVCFKATFYYIDPRLQEFRDVKNPHQRILFDSGQGREILKMFRLITCPFCGQSLAVSPDNQPGKIQCVRCIQTFCLED